MESFLLFLLVAFLLFIFIVPIAALIRASRAQASAKEAGAQTEILRKRVMILETQLLKSGVLPETQKQDSALEPPPLPDAAATATAAAVAAASVAAAAAVAARRTIAAVELRPQRVSPTADSGDAPDANPEDAAAKPPEMPAHVYGGIPLQTDWKDNNAVLPPVVNRHHRRDGDSFPKTTPPALPPEHDEPQPPESAFDWESFFGTKFFAWVGGLALFLGMVYLIIESFQRGWISPVARVCIGAAVGAGLIAGGVFFRNTVHRTTMQTLTATGVVILFADIYACHAFYQFAAFTEGLTFALMAGLAAAAFLLAGLMRAQVVAVLGLLAGFATPVLVSTGQDKPVVLFGYLAVLTAAVLATGGRFRWPSLSPLAGVGFVLIFVGWYAQFGHNAAVYGKSPEVWIPLTVAFLFPLLHLAGTWAVGRAEALNGGESPEGTASGKTEVEGKPEEREPEKTKAVGENMAATALTLSFVPLLLCASWLCSDFWRGETVLTLVGLFAAGLPAIGVAILRKTWGWAVPAVSVATAFALGVWIAIALKPELLWTAMGAVVVFALLHGVGPLALQRKGWLLPPGETTHLATLGGLGLALVVLCTRVVPMPGAVVWILALSGGAVALGLAKRSIAVLGGVLALGAACFAALVLVPVRVNYFTHDSILWWLGAVCVFAGGLIAVSVRGLSAASAGETEKTEKVEGWQVLLYSSCGIPYVLLVMVESSMSSGWKMLQAGPEMFGTLAVLGTAAVLGGILAVAANWLRAPKLFAVALAGTLSVEYLCLIMWQRVSELNAAFFFWWGLGFGVAWTVVPLAGWRRWRESVFPWRVAALALPLSYLLLRDTIPFGFWDRGEFKGLLPLVLALPGAAVFAFLYAKGGAKNPARVPQLAWLGGSVLFFVTLIFPEQFERQWLTLGWALEAAALCALMRRVPHGGLGATALGLLVVVFARLTVFCSPWAGDWVKGATVFNVYLYTYGVAVACFAGAAWGLEGSGPEKWRSEFGKAARILRAAAVLLVFLLVNIEIADYFAPEGAGRLSLDVTGNWHGKADFARGMSFTLAWGVFALGLVGAGLWRRAVTARWVGLGLLGVTLGKVFLFDLAGLENLYRVAALLGTAVVAIVASLLYQRFLRMSRR